MKRTKVAKEPEPEDGSLAVIYPLILQAIKDTTVWLSTKASTEERVHIRRAQARLNELAGICERHRDLHAPPAGNKEWNQVATELLSLVQKGADTRGCIVGHGLRRLVKLLAPPAKNERKLPKQGEDRSNRVQVFIESVFQVTNQRIKKKDISLVAGYKNPMNIEHRNCDRVIVGFQRITSPKS